MATGQVVTDNGKLITVNRTFLSSPTITAPSLFSVGTGTTTPTISDTSLETPVNINGGQTKAFLSGFPTIDATNFQSTIRCFLNSLEANGNNLTEWGVFNSDGSPLMFSRMVFTSITKTSSLEVTLIEKDKVL